MACDLWRSRERRGSGFEPKQDVHRSGAQSDLRPPKKKGQWSTSLISYFRVHTSPHDLWDPIWMIQSVPAAVEDTGAAVLTKQNLQSIISHRRVKHGSEPGPWGTFLPIPCYSHQSITSAQTRIKGSLPERIAREAAGSSGRQRQAYPQLAWGKGLG